MAHSKCSGLSASRAGSKASCEQLFVTQLADFANVLGMELLLHLAVPNCKVQTQGTISCLGITLRHDSFVVLIHSTAYALHRQNRTPCEVAVRQTCRQEVQVYRRVACCREAAQQENSGTKAEWPGS